MRLLDLFCGAGGCGVGYRLAGFDVVGVDIEPQRHYPFEFIRADAMEVLGDQEFLRQFDLVHASPPCQGYSVTRSWNPHKQHPMLIRPVRSLLLAAGVPYVIENVAGARSHMREPVMLCGTTFGLRTYRHRLFECTAAVSEPRHVRHVWRQARRGLAPVGSEFVGFDHFAQRTAGAAASQQSALGIDWMTTKELSQAIPPAYTRYIGRCMAAGPRAGTTARHS
jgi:DNA (cytosine-5)-methyltransferase 1